MNIFTLIRTMLKGPTPQMMAAQLRKPSGLPAGKVAKRMNEVNTYLYQVVLEELQKSPNTQVLELGFGNGLTTLPLFDRVPDIHYTGLDFSQTMVTAASKTFAAHIAGGRARLHEGSSDSMPFPDASFDAVFGVNTIYFWDDYEAHLREIARVLKPGGRFISGYRDRTSMLALPFTKYGFTMYETHEWEQVLKTAGFLQVRTVSVQEPEREWDGARFYVKACCTAAERA